MRKILLIEDDITLRENTAELLELTDYYEVIMAENGKVGIEKALSELPDLIVCDIMMPEVDGYGVLEILSKNPKTQFTPFIFLSAKTERSDVRKGMNLGADDYITKPFTEEELISAIESRLAKSSILKEQKTVVEEIPNENELRDLNDLKNFFDDNGTVFSFQGEEKVYEEGDNSNYIYLVTKGGVKCSKLNEQGKVLTTSLYKEDDLFGYTSFSQNIPYQETAVAMEATELVGIHKSELISVLHKNHKVVLDLVDLLADNLKDVKEQLLDMAYNSVHKKTAATLLKFAERMNRNPDDVIRIARHDLASVAGIATETLIRSISKLKKSGIIEIEGRNIKIVDMEALKLVE
ncbi:response regulator [uncultured Tenacibaculum sp.]|uniref:response regulator n=1 Tax=uncultured Tenacibaculum sp. TaxID=174713 RepID=UPI0026252637|nr:response regulator [uncultured Tenacibaculum sp.]